MVGFPFDDTVTGNLPLTPEGMALRQRLALQMMGNTKKGYPKNVGEGLTAIGDSLGEIGMARRLEAQMAAMERLSAARGGGAAAQPTPVPAVPGSNNPATGAQTEAAPPVATADATPAAASAVPGLLMAAANNDAYQPADALPPVQDAGGAPQTASADTGTVSDAPPVGAPTGAPNPDAVRNSIAQLLQTQRAGGAQPNPMLGGSSPADLPSTLAPDPAYLGSPDRSAENRPITVQLAGPPTGIKPSGAPSEPVPEAPKQPRTEEMPYTPPKFGNPPRMADPGKQELDYMRAANDPGVLGSYQKLYAAEAARLAQQRKDDHDQAIKAYESRDLQTRAAQERASRDAETKLNLQKLEDERQARKYTETITRHLGGRNPATIEENLYKSRASIANVPAITQSLQRVNAVVDKMYTGPTADVNTFLSQLLPTFPGGFDPAKGTATQQFRTAMTDIMAAHRAAVVGPGSQSGPELALLQKSTAADAKLNVDTIKESLQAAERLMVKTAIAHQKEVHNYAGNFDPDRTRSVFGSFGVPGIEDVVPQRTITKLMPYATDQKAKDDFDETYHTPGLADALIKRELLRQGRR